MNCDHCSETAPVVTTLRNVHFDEPVVSRLEPEMTVCLSCQSEMAADPDITWD